MTELRPIAGLAILWTVVAAPVSAPAQSATTSKEGNESIERRDVRELLDSFDDEPSAREVQRAALRDAGLDPEVPKGWASRARWANLVPDLEGEVAWLEQTDRQLEYDEDFEFESSAELDPDSADHGFEEDERSRRKYSLEAEVELGGLVFDRDEIYAAREVRQQQTTRQKLISTVSDLYYERRMKQVLRIVTPERKWRKRLKLAVTIEKLDAKLDGLTGGWFSRQLPEGRR